MRVGEAGRPAAASECGHEATGAMFRIRPTANAAKKEDRQLSFLAIIKTAKIKQPLKNIQILNISGQFPRQRWQQHFFAVGQACASCGRVLESPTHRVELLARLHPHTAPRGEGGLLLSPSLRVTGTGLMQLQPPAKYGGRRHTLYRNPAPIGIRGRRPAEAGDYAAE